MIEKQEGSVELEAAVLHFTIYGKAKKKVIAFHGYGQGKEYFEALSHSLGKEFQLYAFDLFYHGESFWHKKDKPLTKEFWSEMVQTFLLEQQIDAFSLVGYSMGGKFALATLESFPDKTERLILIAPDGIKTSFWYSLASYPSVFRRLFRSFVVRPQYFNRLVQGLYKAKIMDKGVIKFAETQMRTRRQRRRVYFTWVVFRKLKFDLKKIARLINRHGIKTAFFLGKYDRIIRPENMNRLLKHLDNYELKVLETGHNQLVDEVANYFLKKPLKD